VSEEALQAAVEASRGYSNLEYDLYEGERGHRMGHVASLLTQLTGAEAALAVNNNASAVMLVLATFCVGKEVVVSRGEAVEIGGGFRIPDVLRQSGATLVEVGTTNRTYVRDYQAATTPDTAAYLKVHASNFRVTGFTHEATLAELARLGKERAVLVIHDLGSGSLLRTEHYGMAHEPMPQESVEAGADLVCFSTDKLLGGPQGGVVIGKQELVERLARHPLTRALRMGKLDLAALSATLGHYLKGEAQAKIPIWRMVSAPLEEMNARARGWCAAIGSRASVIDGQSTVGGGSLPGETLPTRLMALRVADLPGGAEGVLRRLREAEMPVIGRILDDQVVLDPRTVFAEEDVPLLQAVRKVVGA
jgi:L-seryl-tRNA(Ser) seleniumtransferase